MAKAMNENNYGVFAKGQIWSGSGSRTSLGGSDQITGGDLSLKLATGRTDGGAVNYATPTVVLNSGLKQTNYEVGYTRLIRLSGMNAKVGLNLIYIKNPANSPGFNHDLGLMAMIGVRV